MPLLPTGCWVHVTSTGWRCRQTCAADSAGMAERAAHSILHSPLEHESAGNQADSQQLLVRGPSCPERTYPSLSGNRRFSISFFDSTVYKKEGAEWDGSLCLNKRVKEKVFLLTGCHPPTQAGSAIWFINFPSTVLRLLPQQLLPILPSPILSLSSLVVEEYDFMTVVGWPQPEAKHPHSNSFGSPHLPSQYDEWENRKTRRGGVKKKRKKSWVKL